MKTVNWINVLHFYQPPFQDRKIVKRVTEECYLPVSRFLLERPDAKAVVNINSCLLDMLDKDISKGKDAINNFKTMLSRGQIEITGTGKYHPLFPLISKREIERQLALQNESLNHYLNIQKMPNILFLPECAYLPEQMPFFKKKGFRWVIIDEISLRKGNTAMGKSILKEKESGIKLLVRDRDISKALVGSLLKKYNIQTAEEFLNLSLKKTRGKGFIVTALDVGSLGKQQKERWKLLSEIYDNPAVISVSVKNISSQYDISDVDTIPASWSTSKSDISGRIYYPLWYHPQNRLHRLLWQLLDITVDEVRARGSESQNKKMDQLLSSCPFLWSSCMPWWDGNVVERASDSMVNLLKKTEHISGKFLWITESLRKRIYGEVSMLNKTGKAKELQNEFLKKQKS